MSRPAAPAAHVNRTTIVVIGGLISGALLLGGCSSSADGVAQPAGRTAQTVATPPTGGTVATKPTGGTASAKPGVVATPPRATSTTASGSGGQEAPAAAVSISGAITKVAPASMQVRSGKVATTVTWTSGTSFHLTKTATTRAVTKGVCVVATPASKVPGDQTSDRVAGIRVIPAIDGACAEADTIAKQAGDSRTVSGLVTTAKGTAMTLQTKGIGRPTATIKLVLSPKVVVTTSVDATARDLAVGRCAVAVGTSQSPGGVAATMITVSDRRGTSCPT